MSKQAFKIIAPICSLQDAREVIQAGADELYCGVMLDSWVNVFGDSDLISRRQGRLSHVNSLEELASIAKLADEAGKSVALTLNVRYVSSQEKSILEIAEIWENMGGKCVLISDIGILISLQKVKSNLTRHLSLMAGVFNSDTANFFEQFGIARAVLPRDFTIKEIDELIRFGPPIEYEVLVMNQKCTFIDNMCGFMHGTRLPDDKPSWFEYHHSQRSQRPIVWSIDPDYEGHGCQLNWKTEQGFVSFVESNDGTNPSCGACALPQLANAGVGFFKIAGRGYPRSMIIRSISFLREALEIIKGEDGMLAKNTRDIKRLYEKTYGTRCNKSNCYYSD